MARTVSIDGGKLYPPGSRKGNRFWLFRGTVAGRGVEFSTKQRDKADAIRTAREYLDALSRGSVPEVLTFEAVAAMYMDHRQSSEQDRRFIARLTEHAGDVHIRDVRPAHMTSAIRAYYPNATAATINRQVWAMYSAIVHFAAEQEWCEYRRVRRMKETEPGRSPAPEGAGEMLMANTDGLQHAFVAVLYYQGWRISEILALRWEGVDMNNRSLHFFISKPGKWKMVAMSDPVLVALSALSGPRTGRVFPWSVRRSVYNWWVPLVERLGMPKVRPHNFRHSFGMDGRAAHAGDDDLLEIGSWTNRKSVSIYTRHPSGAARELLGKMRGK